jgi:ribonuclease R
MGDKVRIKVIAANLTKRQLDYEWVITSNLPEGEVPLATGGAKKSSYPIPKKKSKGGGKKKKK